MNLEVFAILITLVCDVIRMTASARKQNAAREGSDECRSCLECSHDNGCVRCPERLFLFLQREGMAHHGSCLHACPAGHYGQRGKDINRCMKCRSVECTHCFNRDFCTKCKPGLQLYKGKCLTSCPEGTFIQQTDCLESCTQSPVSDWSEWGLCLRDALTCGFRWGKQTRTRELSWSTPGEKALLCPSNTETRRCRMKKRCTKEGEKNKQPRQGKKRERKRLQMLANGTITTESPGGDERDAHPIEVHGGTK